MRSHFDKKRVLVTGGAGFLGSHLCDRLLKSDNYVICLDNFYTGHWINISHLTTNKNFKFLKHDIINPIRLNVDEIYNLACPASPVHYQRDPVYTLKTNIFGASNTSEIALKSSAKILHASTSEVYGDPEVHPQVESYWGNVNPIGLRSCYDEGKRCAETLLFDHKRQNNLKLKVARIYNTYGPRLHPSDGRVVSNFILQAINNEPVTVYGTGTQTRSFCYVDDLIEGLVRFMSIDEEFAGPINLGSPIETSILELAKTVIKLTQSASNIEYLPLPSDDPAIRQPNIGLAESKLKWQPKVSLKDGLEKTIAYFQKLASNIPFQSQVDADVGATTIQFRENVATQKIKEPIKVIVTGGFGFIGTHVSKRLVNDGYQVLALDNSKQNTSNYTKKRMQYLIQTAELEYQDVDVGDFSKLEKVFSDFQPQQVVHLAATPGIREPEFKFSEYLNSNLIGHANVLELCRIYDIQHFLYASSSSVYGNSVKKSFRENDSTDEPISMYAATKRSNELVTEVYSHLYRQRTTGIRVFSAYGPWGRPDMAYFNFAKKMIKNETITVFSKGELKRDFTYIDDIVEAIIRLLNRTDDRSELHQIYNIGHGNPKSILELVTALETILNVKAKIKYQPMELGDVNITFSNNKKIMQTIQYKPDTKFYEGLELFCSWLEDYMQSNTH